MNKFLFVLAAFAAWAPLGAVAAPFTADAAGLVHLDPARPDTLYNYFAAYPVFNYAAAGVIVREPFFTDDAQAPSEGLLARRLWLVGGPADAGARAAAAACGVAVKDAVRADGDVFAVAAALAANWLMARRVVVAPYIPGDDKAPANAAWAAALAAALNAPLLYTYGARTPPETVAVLARLGAVEVFVVDLGDVCADDVLVRLGKGRRAPRRFTRAADVEAFAQGEMKRAAAGVKAVAA